MGVQERSERNCMFWRALFWASIGVLTVFSVVFCIGVFVAIGLLHGCDFDCTENSANAIPLGDDKYKCGDETSCDDTKKWLFYLCLWSSVTCGGIWTILVVSYCCCPARFHASSHSEDSAGVTHSWGVDSAGSAAYPSSEVGSGVKDPIHKDHADPAGNRTSSPSEDSQLRHMQTTYRGSGLSVYSGQSSQSGHSHLQAHEIGQLPPVVTVITDPRTQHGNHAQHAEHAPHGQGGYGYAGEVGGGVGAGYASGSGFVAQAAMQPAPQPGGLGGGMRQSPPASWGWRLDEG